MPVLKREIAWSSAVTAITQVVWQPVLRSSFSEPLRFFTFERVSRIVAPVSSQIG